MRRILEEVIEEIDGGRLRPRVPPRLRTRIGGTVVAVALGLGAAACDGRVVGTVTDAGGPPDVAHLDPPDVAHLDPPDVAHLDPPDVAHLDPPDAEVLADAAIDSGPLTTYGFPWLDPSDAGAQPEEDADQD